MPAYLCRYPNGALSFAFAEDFDGAVTEFMVDDVCCVEESGGKDPLVRELPKGFRIHLHLNDAGGFEFRGWTAGAIPTIEEFYPHLTKVFNADVTIKQGRAYVLAVANAVAKERNEIEGD